jgi:hypothetical protein
MVQDIALVLRRVHALALVKGEEGGGGGGARVRTQPNRRAVGRESRTVNRTRLGGVNVARRHLASDTSAHIAD